MLNKVWCGLLLAGILYGFVRAACHDWQRASSSPGGVVAEEGESSTGPPASGPLASAASAASAAARSGRGLAAMGRDLNAAALDAAESSVKICIGLIGVMALWLGLLNVAREAGLVDAFARLLRPLMRRLFPEIPADHPAQGAILMNLSANMLGLENAATPLGLKAMKELQTLNAQPDTATNSMATFLAINTSNVTLIPFAIIGYRQLSGSQDPARPMLAMLLATTISTAVAVVAARMLQRLPRYAAPTVVSAGAAAPAISTEVAAVDEK